MAEKMETAPLTEPVIVPCIFVEGVKIEVKEGFVRFTAWTELTTVPEGALPERRIVNRVAVPEITARRLLRDLRKLLMQAVH